MTPPIPHEQQTTADTDLVAKIDHLVVVTLEGARRGPVESFLAQNFASVERPAAAAEDPWVNRVELLTGQPSPVEGPVGPSTELIPRTVTMFDRLDENYRTWRAYRCDSSVLWAMRRTYRPTMAYGAMHLDTVPNFLEDARSGDLPAVSCA